MQLPLGEAPFGVIFDLDGLLIDSEPVWQQAEMDVFAKLGLQLSRSDCLQTHGLRVDSVVKYWHDRFPWTGVPLPAVESQLIDRFLELFEASPRPKAGVNDVIEMFRQRSTPMGIASSSYERVIRSAVRALSLDRDILVMQSAEHEERGKPDPAVYLSAARALGIPPSRILAFEDSLTGLTAAKAAGMFCIFVPDQQQPNDAILGLADRIAPSLQAVTEDMIRGLYPEF